MTVAAASVVLGPFTPNGSVTDWPFTFTAYADGEVVPRLVTDSGSSIPSHVTTRNNVEDITAAGGTVVIDPPLASGSGELWISYIPSFEQETEFADQDRWSPTVMNYALDRAASRDQYVKALLDRAQKAPLGETAPAIPSAAYRAGTIRVWNSDGSAERTDVSYAALLALITHDVTTSSTDTLSLAAYLTPAMALSDAQVAAYPSKAGWTDVTALVRQAFSDAADLGLKLSYGGLTGNFYINPLTPILIRNGCGWDGGAFANPALAYTSDGVSVVKDVIVGGGLNFVVDPLDATTRKVPKFALQGRTDCQHLSIIGVGLAGANLLNVSAYPVITGADEFFTDAPVIVTDHQHLSDGTYTGPGHNNKVSNINLSCSLLGVMQGVYIGDPRLDEEPWAGLTASGLVTGTGGNDISVYTGPCLRSVISGRKTSTGTNIYVQLDQPRWTGVTQPQSGGLFDLAWIKLVQQYGIAVDMWHRAVGFTIDCPVRGLRYGVKMQAGYSDEGPTFDPPTVGDAVALGDVISATNGDVFLATVAGSYTTRPIASGANYNTTTKVFTDPGSALRWTWQCRRPDTGKYNAGSISVRGERIIQPVYVHVNAYMHNVPLRLNGHFMDEYNLKHESGAAVDIRSHRLIAGAIDKAVYSAWVTAHAYDYGDKISDAFGNVWVVAAPGTSTTIPTRGAAVAGIFTDGDLKWRYRNGGWKAFGDGPFARVVATGVIQEISGPLFRNTAWDGHQSFNFDTMSTAAWSQAVPTDALIINLSPLTTVKHGSSQTYAAGKSDRVYDVVDEARLHVGFNDHYGYDLSTVAAGDYPRQIGSNKLSATFFDFKNCMAHDFDPATGDGDDGDDGDD